MVTYKVYYKKTSIGILCISDEGKHKYISNKENIEKIEKTSDICIIPDAKKDRDWGEPIMFFENRITNCKRFGIEDIVKYPNSEYYLKKEN